MNVAKKVCGSCSAVADADGHCSMCVPPVPASAASLPDVNASGRGLSPWGMAEIFARKTLKAVEEKDGDAEELARITADWVRQALGRKPRFV